MANKILFRNGNIITMDKKMPLAHNMLVEGPEIVALNVDENSFKKDVKLFDLRNKTVIPGLNDSHVHMVAYGISLDMVDLNGVQSIDELKRKIKKHIEANNLDSDEWIFGRGWNDDEFKENRKLRKEDLDEVSTKHPIVLTRTCGHLRSLNSTALKECGITSNTKIEGGLIDKDNDGQLTGLVGEEAKELIYNSMPEYSLEDFKRFIVNGAKNYRKSGLTTVQSDDFEASSEPEEKVLEAYLELAENNELPIRVNLQLQIRDLNRIYNIFTKYNHKKYSDYFTIGPLKIVPDGSLGAKTAALKEPYSNDKNNYGVMIDSTEMLEAKIDMAYRLNVQVACHAIGDRALEIVLNIIEKMRDRYGRTGRPRIIHAQVKNLDLINKMKELNVIADVQPLFVATDWKYAENILGKNRCFNSYAWKTMIDKGIVVSGGSDSPVEPYNPFSGIKCAVTRQDNNLEPSGGWMPHEKVTVFDALKMYTINSSYSCYQEDRIGKLAPNYLADFLVLDKNPYEINFQELNTIQVETSVVNGNIKEYI